MSDHNHDHDHDHDHEHHSLDEIVHSGNVQISADTTAGQSFAELHAALPSYSLEQIVDDLDNLTTWTTPTVTYSFPLTESDDYAGNYREGTLAPFTAAQASAMRDIIALFQDVIGIELVDQGRDINAEIRMYNSTLPGTAAASSAGTGLGGDMWVYNYTPETAASYNLTPGNYQWHLLAHELGHALGLSHTSFVSGDSYAERATYLENNAAYTVMSYLTADFAGLDWATSYASTPMLADVAALQSIYGANQNTRTSDTVYGFNATADRSVFDIDALLETNQKISAFTIWDAGGTDTLDMSGFYESGLIDLTDGQHSSVGGNDLNVAIAAGAIIENATSGAGDDVLRGNSVANVLIGGVGSDTINGDDGDDRLIGDTLASNTIQTTRDMAEMTGSDRVDVTVNLDGVSDHTVELLIGFEVGLTDTQWGNAMPGGWSLVYDPANAGLWYRANDNWHFTGIEPSAFDDGSVHRVSVTYNSAQNEAQIFLDGVYISTAEGVEVPSISMTSTETLSFTHDGLLADIRIFDTLRTAKEIRENAFTALSEDTGNLRANFVFDASNASGRDTVANSAIDVSAVATIKRVDLFAMDDVLNGGEGQDELVGGEGADTLSGGSGSDILKGGQQRDILQGGKGHDSLFGGADRDKLIAGKGDDTLTGGADRDVLDGGTGADVLNGGSGRDTASYRKSDGAVTVDLQSGTANGADAAGDTLLSIERVVGSAFDDVLTGHTGKNWLTGAGGADTITGGDGRDVLTGGNGADVFVFDAADGSDKITDFNVANDIMMLTSGGSFAELTIQTHASGAVVTYDETDITLKGVDALMLTSDHFDFGA